jgi:hypothetical protein
MARRFETLHEIVKAARGAVGPGWNKVVGPRWDKVGSQHLNLPPHATDWDPGQREGSFGTAHGFRARTGKMSRAPATAVDPVRVLVARS